MVHICTRPLYLPCRAVCCCLLVVLFFPPALARSSFSTQRTGDECSNSHSPPGRSHCHHPGDECANPRVAFISGVAGHAGEGGCAKPTTGCTRSPHRLPGCCVSPLPPSGARGGGLVRAWTPSGVLRGGSRGVSLPCCFRGGGCPPGVCTALLHGVAHVYYKYMAEARRGAPPLAPVGSSCSTSPPLPRLRPMPP